MKRFVNYIFDADDTFASGRGLEIGGVRIAVATATVRKMGAYPARLREARAATAGAAGVTVEELGKLKELAPEVTAYANAFNRWARLVVSTVGVQVCDTGTKELDQAVWRDSDLSVLGLDKPETVLDLPVPLFDAWDSGAMLVNEGVFGYDETPDAKKNGKISAI